MRQKCRESFREFLDIQDISRSTHDGVNAFAFNHLRGLCSAFLDQAGKDIIVVDVTCMTRVHLLALSSAVLSMQDWPAEIYFCYATPQSYGFQAGVLSGWKDTLFVPIGRKRFFKREGHARGIVLAGHAGERLSVALQELEPASGRLIYAKMEGRPDLLLRAKEANAFIESRLRLLTMPRANGQARVSDNWRVDVVGMNDFAALSEILSDEVSKVRPDGGPIMIYPFGPKPHTLFASLFLASQPDIQAWAIYPVPEEFDARYSVGVNTLSAYSLRRCDGESQPLQFSLGIP